MNILEIKNLTKKFEDKTVLDDITFQVKQGSIFGFLGQNGAGKTTAMKIILGLLNVDSGKILVCGNTVTYGQTITNKDIGYLPDVPEFYGYMKPKEYLSFCGEICKMKKDSIILKANDLLKLVGLEGVNKKIASFSRGMKQRLGIAQALLNEPKLLVCDEPTSALDPKGRKEIMDILLSIKGKTTVLFSTHILSDAERICDEIAVLHKGKIALSGSLFDIKKIKRQDTIAVEFASSEQAKKFCEQIKGLNAKIEDKTALVHSSNILATQKQIYSEISNLSIYPQKVEILEPTLENLFLEVTE